MTFWEEYTQSLDRVEKALQGCFCTQASHRPLLEAMRYSLLAGGKRLRPILTLKFCEAAGGTWEEAMAFACGVEMLHTYSLIHDDLPCMDNDDLRRGKPTCHKVYGETVATLAGDALQAAAFASVLSAPGPWTDPTVPGKAALVLARAAGENGMCAGQYLDTVPQGAGHTLEELREIHLGKTGALLQAACLMGLYAAAGNHPVEEETFQSVRDFAGHLGLAFQVQDDLLDVISTTEELGKPVGSDAQNGKTTFVTLLGVEGCRSFVRQETDLAKRALKNAFADCDFLMHLTDFLAQREV